MTLLEQMTAAADAAKAEKKERREEEMREMEERFGESLAGGFKAAKEKRQDDAVMAHALKENGNAALKKGK